MGWVNYIDRMIMVFADIIREDDKSFTLDSLVDRMREQPLPVIASQPQGRVSRLLAHEVRKKYITVTADKDLYELTDLGRARYKLMGQTVSSRVYSRREKTNNLAQIPAVSVSQTTVTESSRGLEVVSSTQAVSTAQAVISEPQGANDLVLPNGVPPPTLSTTEWALPCREMAVKLRQHAMDLMRDLKRRDEYIIAIQRLLDLARLQGNATSQASLGLRQQAAFRTCLNKLIVQSETVIRRLNEGTEMHMLQSELDGCITAISSLHSIFNASGVEPSLDDRLNGSREVVRSQQGTLDDASQLLDQWESFWQFMPPSS